MSRNLTDVFLVVQVELGAVITFTVAVKIVIKNVYAGVLIREEHVRMRTAALRSTELACVHSVGKLSVPITIVMFSLH